MNHPYNSIYWFNLFVDSVTTASNVHFVVALLVERYRMWNNADHGEETGRSRHYV